MDEESDQADCATRRRQLFVDTARAFAEASQDLDTILKTVLRQLAEALGDGGAIRLLSEDQQWLLPVAVYHRDGEAHADLKLLLTDKPQHIDEGPNGLVARSGQPLLLVDMSPIQAHPLVQSEYLANMERFGVHSNLTVPLRARGAVMGTLSLVRHQTPRPYTTEDQQLLQELADWASLAIDNARLFQTMQQTKEQLQNELAERTQVEAGLRARERQQAAIANLAQRALLRTGLCMLLSEAIRLVTDMLEVEYGMVLELVPEDDTLLLRTGVGWPDDLIGHATVDTGIDAQARYTLLSNAPVIVEDLRTETRFNGSSLPLMQGIVSGLSVIIPGSSSPGARPFGVLEVHTTSLRSFTEDEVHFLQQVAHVLATAIEREQAEQALKDSAEQFRLLVEGVQDYGIFMLDADGYVVSWNAGAERIKGYRADEIIGQHFSCFYPADEQEHGKPAYMLQLAKADGRVADEGWRVRKDGSRFWAEVVITALSDQAGRLRGFAKVTHDITARKQAETAIRESEERYRLLVEGAKDYAMLLTDPDGLITRWNLGAERIFGYTEAEILGQPLSRIFTPEDIAHGAPVDELRTALMEGRAEDERWHMRKDGTRFWASGVNTPLRDEAGELRGFAKVLRDSTVRKQAEEALRRQALHDALTGLPNRALLIDRLAHVLAYAQRHPTFVFAVLFLDLDRFKTINDSLGHLAGDQLLLGVAHRLQAILRHQDTIARLGGDEFVVVLEDINEISDVTHVADRIHQALTTPFQINGVEVVTNVSIGITLSTSGYTRPEELLRDADTALYRAKAQGRGRYEIFDTTMHAHVLQRLQLETDLRQALERQQFELHYQPIVTSPAGVITGVEALLRWNHPERGLTAPAEFIPLAEEMGLIVPLGEWVLRTACAQTRAWHDAGLPLLTVAINLSAHNLRHADLPNRIAAILEETGLAPQYLKLELTENSIMDNIEMAIALLAELDASGVQVVIDDFGSGYSSLSYLKRLPITGLKLDRTFVRDINTDAGDAAIASAITALAHRLNVIVTAEGVETEAELGFLQAQQVDEIQGYLFSRPLPAETVTQCLQQGNQPGAWGTSGCTADHDGDI
jgi:diguanylate cyclase (GGDEF)-like protein/PAS domain S-box-containing protein